ncbi:uncharacterized protein LOC134266919 [Saccostrea cucullata]|uniref:uncharacterized protein LOC134266919 n=1 Tax=Saccostrea cuccullata TaxID=36930 RepID=UPI002ED515A1
MLGGLIGASLVFGILSERDYNSSAGGATVLSSRTEPGWGVVTEAILTFMLILTVLMTTMDEKKHKLAPLAIGFAVTVGVMAGFLFETSGRQRKNPYLWSQSSTSERLDGGDLVLN